MYAALPPDQAWEPAVDNIDDDKLQQQQGERNIQQEKVTIGEIDLDQSGKLMADEHDPAVEVRHHDNQGVGTQTGE